MFNKKEFFFIKKPLIDVIVYIVLGKVVKNYIIFIIELCIDLLYCIINVKYSKLCLNAMW